MEINTVLLYNFQYCLSLKTREVEKVAEHGFEGYRLNFLARKKVYFQVYIDEEGYKYNIYLTRKEISISTNDLLMF